MAEKPSSFFRASPNLITYDTMVKSQVHGSLVKSQLPQDCAANEKCRSNSLLDDRVKWKEKADPGCHHASFLSWQRQQGRERLSTTLNYFRCLLIGRLLNAKTAHLHQIQNDRVMDHAIDRRDGGEGILEDALPLRKHQIG
jgi:hypothetical protein